MPGRAEDAWLREIRVGRGEKLINWKLEKEIDRKKCNSTFEQPETVAVERLKSIELVVSDRTNHRLSVLDASVLYPIASNLVASFEPWLLYQINKYYRWIHKWINK